MTIETLDIAIAVYRLLAGGGLERHAIRLAEELAERGHKVTLYTTASGPLRDGLAVTLVPRRGLTNQGRLLNFSHDLAGLTGGRHDLLIGFQKMAGLDMLVCCDWCFAERRLTPFEKLMPRYRIMARMEAACFAPDSPTRLLMLADPQAQVYRDAYAVDAGRMTVLPPTLDRRRVVAAPAASERASMRTELGIADDETAWLWIGLQPQVKGLDRAIRALAASPQARLLVCGADPARRSLKAALALASRLGCGGRIRTSGVVDDRTLQRHLLAADLLVHPARLDVTGTVIVEALGAGLPVIVTENCGYATHVAQSGAGVVVARDASPEQIAAAARVDADALARWSAAARAYVSKADLTSGIATAASLAEAEARIRRGQRPAS